MKCAACDQEVTDFTQASCWMTPEGTSCVAHMCCLAVFDLIAATVFGRWLEPGEAWVP